MIKFRLKDLLKEKNISINKLSTETGISRPSLTAMYNNESRGVQFDTLEKLMAFFNVEFTDIIYDDEDSNVFMYSAPEKKQVSKETTVFYCIFSIRGQPTNVFNITISPTYEVGTKIITSLGLLVTETSEDMEIIKEVKHIFDYFYKLTPKKMLELTMTLTAMWLARNGKGTSLKFSNSLNINFYNADLKYRFSFPIIVESTDKGYFFDTDYSEPFISNDNSVDKEFSDSLIIINREAHLNS